MNWINLRSQYDHSNCIQIRPYHALLLLQSPEELVAELPLDYCSDIKRIAESALPTKSLSKLAMDTALDEQFVRNLEI